MQVLEALNSRRASIEKINKVTRAMEVIAATRLRHCEQKALNSRAYIQAQQALMQNLALRLAQIRSLWAKPIKQAEAGLAIVISSDRGFCGGFNNQLGQLIREPGYAQIFSFLAVGKKGVKLLGKQQCRLIYQSALPKSAELWALAQQLSEKIIAAFQEQPQPVELIFNSFRRNLLGQSARKRLLPLAPSTGANKIVLDYLLEPDIEELMPEIMPVYLATEIKAAILESRAAEEMARMLAMSQATTNGEELIQSLTLQYHKARQAGITRELIEIVNAS